MGQSEGQFRGGGHQYTQSPWVPIAAAAAAVARQEGPQRREGIRPAQGAHQGRAADQGVQAVEPTPLPHLVGAELPGLPPGQRWPPCQVQQLETSTSATVAAAFIALSSTTFSTSIICIKGIKIQAIWSVSEAIHDTGYLEVAWRPDSLTPQRVWPRSIGKRLFPGWWTLV